LHLKSYRSGHESFFPIAALPIELRVYGAPHLSLCSMPAIIAVARIPSSPAKPSLFARCCNRWRHPLRKIKWSPATSWARQYLFATN